MVNKSQIARGTWLLITFVSILFYLLSAWAYQQVLLSEPFFGSTVQPGVINLNSVRLGLAQWGISLDEYTIILVAEQAVITVTCCILGGLIFWRGQADRLAWIMGLILVLIGTQIPVQAYALGRLFPVWGFLGFATNQIGTTVNLLLIWIFPNGRFVPSWSRWTFTLVVVLGVFATLNPDTYLAPIFVPGALVLICSGLLAQLYRYTCVSGLIERQQTKWVLFALMIAPATWVISALLIPVIFPLLTLNSENAAPYNLLRLTFGNFANLLIPLFIGLSILRYRLYDIDVIIRRTLQYSVLTGILGLVYFGTIVLLQGLFRSLTGNIETPLIVVISTLLIAALFNPLRRRIQTFIDRRFYRRKYNAERALADFGVFARNQTDLQALTRELQSLVQTTMQPERLSLWIRPAIEKRAEKPG